MSHYDHNSRAWRAQVITLYHYCQYLLQAQKPVASCKIKCNIMRAFHLALHTKKPAEKAGFRVIGKDNIDLLSSVLLQQLGNRLCVGRADTLQRGSSFGGSGIGVSAILQQPRHNIQTA